MATANRNGGANRRADDMPDPERTQRIQPIQEVVDRWFGEDPETSDQGSRAQCDESTVDGE